MDEALKTLSEAQRKAVVAKINEYAEINTDILRTPELSSDQRTHFCGFYDGVKSVGERLSNLWGLTE